MLNRPCGCGARGRHKPTCILSTNNNDVKESKEVDSFFGGGVPFDGLTREVYEKRKREEYEKSLPHIHWSSKKTRQTTVENRIKNLAKRRKTFFLTVDEKYDWIVVSGVNVSWTREATEMYGYEKSETQKARDIQAFGKANKHFSIGGITTVLPFFSAYSGENGVPFESWLSPSFALDKHATHCSGAVCDWDHGVKLGEPDPTKKRRKRK